MFADFKDIFDQGSTRVPKEILAAMNKKLPNIEMEYIQAADSEDGMCILVPKISDKSPEIEIKLSIPGGIVSNEIPSDVKTKKDLMEYIYRTQTCLEVDVKDKKSKCTIVANGNELDLSESVKFPLRDITIGPVEKIYLSPPPFPKVDPLTVEFLEEDENDNILPLIISLCRIPDEREEALVFVSNDDLWVRLKIELLLKDRKILSGKLNFHFDYAKCHSVSEFVYALKASNKFIKGKYRIPILSKTSGFKRTPIDKDYISFWERVNRLENKIDVKFSPNTDLPIKDVQNFQKLFRCFLERKPFAGRMIKTPKFLVDKNDICRLEKSLRSNIELTYSQDIELELAGAKIKMIEFSCIFNATISRLGEEKSKKHFMELEPYQKDFPIYISTQYFLNESEMNSTIDRFSDMKALRSYFLCAENLDGKAIIMEMGND